jgi:hypothetical protein
MIAFYAPFFHKLKIGKSNLPDFVNTKNKKSIK